MPVYYLYFSHRHTNTKKNTAALQRGVSSLETAVALMVFLLLALAAYESAHWLLLRQALNTALLDTARIAATQQAHPQIIHEAFSNALERLPAFALKNTPQHWHIERRPTTSVAAASTTQHSYQALQYQQGNTQIFNANTLHLRLHYKHAPITPVIRKMLGGIVPIVTDIQVSMQSDQTTDSMTAASSSPPPDESAITPNSPPVHDLPEWQPPPHYWQPPGATPPTAPPFTATPPITPEDSCTADSCCGPTP